MQNLKDMQSVVNLKQDDKDPCCAFCIHSREIPGQPESRLCSRKGMVTQDYLCRKFSLDITVKTARRIRTLPKRYHAEDFSIEE